MFRCCRPGTEAPQVCSLILPSLLPSTPHPLYSFARFLFNRLWERQFESLLAVHIVARLFVFAIWKPLWWSRQSELVDTHCTAGISLAAWADIKAGRLRGRSSLRTGLGLSGRLPAGFTEPLTTCALRWRAPLPVWGPRIKEAFQRSNPFSGSWNAKCT